MVSKNKIKINPRVGNVYDTPMYFEGAIRKTAKEKKQATLLVPTIAGPRHARTEHHTSTPHHTTPPPRRLPLSYSCAPGSAASSPPRFQKSNPSRNAETPSTIAHRRERVRDGAAVAVPLSVALAARRPPAAPCPERKAGPAARSSAPSPSLPTGAPLRWFANLLRPPIPFPPIDLSFSLTKPS
jgi:hypothetical protein